MTTASIQLLSTLTELRRSHPDISFVDELIADNLAIAWAASVTPIAREVLDSMLVGTDGGACSVIGREAGAPPAQAAFSNSALAHILDFDDIYDRGRLHPTTVVLPAALAAGELVGASSADVRRGVLLGGEAMCRFGVSVSPTATGPAAHWFITQLVGYVGAAISAATAMGLDDETVISAIGLSVMQAAGTKQPASTPGSTARAIYPAFAAAGGVTAALLARGGMRGAADALDGPDGLLPLYLGMTALPEAFFATDGWRYSETSIKPWPCCRISHPYVSAALATYREFGALDLDAIDEVRLDVNASALKLCVPLDARVQPITLQDAKYSIPFMTAHALVHGTVNLDTTGDACLSDARVLDLARRVTIHDGLPDGPGHPPAVVTVRQGEHTHRATANTHDMDGNGAAAHSKLVQCFAYSDFPDPEDAARSLRRDVAQMGDGSISLSTLLARTPR
jgi:2-methylcitrate dehydratase PrpD